MGNSKSKAQRGQNRNKRPKKEAVKAWTPTKPLLVSVAVAGTMLGFGKTKIFQMINDGTLERRKIGGATRVTMRSVLRLAGK